MLLLGIHTVETVTARVPLVIIILNDLVKKKDLPHDLRARLVIPTSGNVQISLWDAPSVEALQTFLDENLNLDCTHSVMEVEEEFMYGFSFQLSQLRAAEKVAAGGRSTLESLKAAASTAGGGLQKQLEALDQRTHLLSATEEALKRVKVAASRAATAAAGEGEAGGSGSVVNNLHSGVQAGLTKASSTFSWLGTKVKSLAATTKAQGQRQEAAEAGAYAGGGGSTPPPPSHSSPPDYYSALGMSPAAFGAPGAAATPGVPVSQAPPVSSTAVDAPSASAYDALFQAHQIPVSSGVGTGADSPVPHQLQVTPAAGAALAPQASLQLQEAPAALELAAPALPPSTAATAQPAEPSFTLDDDFGSSPGPGPASSATPSLPPSSLAATTTRVDQLLAALEEEQAGLAQQQGV